MIRAQKEGTLSEQYVIVVNDQRQYSVWRVGRDAPAGWAVVGGPASRTECLDRIAELWTDMRPASVRGSGGATA